MSTINSTVRLTHASTSMSFTLSSRRTPNNTGFGISQIEVLATDEALTYEYPTCRHMALRLMSGDDCRVGLDGSTYPFRLSGADDFMTLRLDVEGLRETITITPTADSAGSMAGDYFDLTDRSTYACRVWMNVPIKAKGTLTLTGNAVADETVTIGSVVYTWKASAASANQVLIGASASESIDNLIAAVNGAAGSGTLYGTGTVANTMVSAAVGAGDTMGSTARTAGTAGNSLATGDTMTNASWGAGALSGGTDSTTPPATPSNGRLLQVNIAEGSTAATVAAALQVALDADAEFIATISGSVVTCSDQHVGTRTNVADGGGGAATGWTFSTTQGGAAAPVIHLKSAGTSNVVVAIIPN